MGEVLQLDTCMDVLVQFFKDNLAAVAGAAVAFTLPMVEFFGHVLKSIAVSARHLMSHLCKLFMKLKT